MLKGGAWQRLIPDGQRVVAVALEPVPCTLTRTDLFDKLASGEAQPPIVRAATGELVRRMDDVREGFQVGGWV